MFNIIKRYLIRKESINLTNNITISTTINFPSKNRILLNIILIGFHFMFCMDMANGFAYLLRI